MGKVFNYKGLRMNLITIDFETYYDKDFSLSKITTEEYIRSPRFEVIGVGVKLNDGESIWLSGDFNAIKTYLHNNYDWAESAVLAHNTMFDGAILSWLFGIRPKLWLDTMCMARGTHGVEVSASLRKVSEIYGVGEKGNEVINALGKRRADFSPEELARYGDYCVNDVELTHRLFNIFMNNGFPMKEVKVIDMTLKMYTNPQLELDLIKLNEHLYTLKSAKDRLLEECHITKDELMSNPKFAEALRALGVEPPTKVSLRTGKETYALAKNDEAFKELQEHENPKVQALVAARIGLKSTLEETRTERFIDIAIRGKLPVPIRYYAAHTGRWGGADKVNLQNLPSRGENAKVLKSCIVAPEGYTLIESDSAQIEARVLAWLAEQNNLVKSFEKGEDVYKKMASIIYNKKEELVTDSERFIGKTTILGAGYGMGAARFRDQLKTFGVDVDEEECRRIIRVYREANGQITQLWRDAQASLVGMDMGESLAFGRPGVLKVLHEHVAIKLPSGLLMRYEDLKGEEEEKGLQFTYKTRLGRVKIYGGKVIENVCQAIARCVMAEQMLRISKRYPIALTVHDSVVCCVNDSEVDEAASYVSECMAYVPEWAKGLPVRGDVEVGKDYGNCKKWVPRQNQLGLSVA